MHIHDDRFVAEINRLKQFGELLGVGQILQVVESRHLFHVFQIGTRTKSLAIAFQDDDTDVVAAVEPIEDLGQFAYQFGIQRITHLGTVKVDPSHAFAQLHFYCLEIHCRVI